MNPKKRCRALTKAGKPCGAAPTSGGLCFFHSNPAKASELGRIGGQRNRRLRGEGTSDVFKWAGAESALERLGYLYEDVITGRIPPPQANVLIKITELQLKQGEKMDVPKLEQKLEDLKQVIAMRDFESATPEDPFLGDEEDDDDDPMP